MVTLIEICRFTRAENVFRMNYIIGTAKLGNDTSCRSVQPRLVVSGRFSI